MLTSPGSVQYQTLVIVCFKKSKTTYWRDVRCSTKRFGFTNDGSRAWELLLVIRRLTYKAVWMSTLSRLQRSANVETKVPRSRRRLTIFSIQVERSMGSQPAQLSVGQISFWWYFVYKTFLYSTNTRRGTNSKGFVIVYSY